MAVEIPHNEHWMTRSTVAPGSFRLVPETPCGGTLTVGTQTESRSWADTQAQELLPSGEIDWDERYKDGGPDEVHRRIRDQKLAF